MVIPMPRQVPLTRPPLSVPNVDEVNEAIGSPGLDIYQGATRSKGHRYQEQGRYRGAPGLTTRSKKLLGTSASLLVTSALLVVTRSY